MASRSKACILVLAVIVCAAVSSVHAARLAPWQAIWPTTPASLIVKKKPARSTECELKEFRSSQLTLIKEMPFIGLFQDIKDETKFEASGMTVAPYKGKNWLWIVFDNLHALGRVDEHFEFADPHNALVGEMGEDSQFEGITYVESTGRFYTVEEVSDHETHGLVPVVHELELADGGQHYHTVTKCHVHFQLVHENKGFEGLHFHEDGDRRLLFGLCEGNFCEGGRRGRTPGNGRIVVTQFNNLKGDDCAWDVVKVLHVPETAYFDDYSGMAFRGNTLAIISQENSAMWVGEFDFDTLEFTNDGVVYNFPRDNHCEMIFCNVEGVQWLDGARLVIASDKAKSAQPYRCIQHDQRLHVFSLPEHTDV